MAQVGIPVALLGDLLAVFIIAAAVGTFVANAGLIAAAIPLMLATRAAVVSPPSTVTNRLTEPTVLLDYQHVMVWGGLHASIPIALVLGLPAGTPPRTELRAMVVGVVAFSLVVQWLTMSSLLDRLGIVTRSDAEELFELLIGRARAVDAALEASDVSSSARRAH